MPVYRPTNAGVQTKGTLWAGFDPNTSAAIAGVFLGSVMFTFAAIAKGKMPWALAVPGLFLLPNVLLLSIVFFLILGKPPRYLRDWAESRILARTEVDRAGVVETENLFEP